jgi:hypothetical protein
MSTLGPMRLYCHIVISLVGHAPSRLTLARYAKNYMDIIFGMTFDFFFGNSKKKYNIPRTTCYDNKEQT